MNQFDVQLQASEKLFKDVTAMQDKADKVFADFNDWKKCKTAGRVAWITNRICAGCTTKSP